MFAAPIPNCEECPLGAAAREGCAFIQKRLPPRSTLLTQGEWRPTVYFIRKGLASLRVTSSDGHEASLAVRGPGSLLYPEALQGRPSLHEVRALSELFLCALPAEELVRWGGPPGSPYRAVVDLLVGGLVQRHQDLQMREGSTLTRVARFLLTVGDPPPKQLNKQLVAAMLGMRRETLSRCLRRLAEVGVLGPGRALRITDLGGLIKLAAGAEA